jgi:FXSXX-COOH protein
MSGIAVRGVMTLQNEGLRSIDPDLRDAPLDRLAESGDSVLAHSLALCQQRLEENGQPLSAFNSNI